MINFLLAFLSVLLGLFLGYVVFMWFTLGVLTSVVFMTHKVRKYLV
jgi:hypothetical protein